MATQDAHSRDFPNTLALTRIRKGPERFEQIVVVGLGYIGLPTAAVFAQHGVKVVGVDINAKAVASINQGKPHIVEVGLENLLRQVVAGGLLRATTKTESGQAFIIAVPTPFKDDHQPDLKYIEAAATTVAPVLEPGNLVILESTSPVGTTEQLALWLAEKRPDLTFPQQAGEDADIQMAHCPERVLPGQILRELVHNDRIVGGMTPYCARRAACLYKNFVQGECLETTASTAEMAKLTENAFRDVNIAFANELSLICDKLNIDVWELIRLANHHPRVKILQPGPGVGGHCIAVDPWFIVASAPKQARLIRTAREVNNSKPHWVVEQTLALAARKKDAVIACLGLSYKPDVDDLRESPAVEIVQELARGAKKRLLAVEPHVTELPRELVSLPVQLVSLEQAVKQADVIVLLVNHRQFSSVDPLALRGKLLLDTRGVWARPTDSASETQRKAA